ncbi:MAG: alkaline phosphatase family protein [Tepidisphaeraceae bacterium]|jgi:YVTN family beta-propeller protein
MKFTARKTAGLLIPLLSLALASCTGESAPIPLNTGKIITPATQTSWDVGHLPMNLALTPDGKYVLASDMGYRQSLWSIRVADGQGVSHLDFNYRAPRKKRAAASSPAGENADAPTVPGSPESNGLYYGLAVGPDHIAYAAQGAHDSIAVLGIGDDGTLTLKDSIKTRTPDFPAGIALDGRGLLYVANNASGGNGFDDPTKISGSVAIYDPVKKSELGRCTFTDSYGGTSDFPFGIAALSDGDRAYVAAERDDAVYALDTSDPAHPTPIARISTGAHPVAVLLSHDETRLFVANSLSDTISVVDTASNQVVGTILLRPDMARDIPGVTPTAMALSRDGNTLFVALSDMNAVGVVDAAAMQLRGYVPVGWYPTALAVVDQDHLLVANAKGTSVRNPNNFPDPYDAKRGSAYILNVIHGNVCTVRIPKEDELAKSTQQVLDDNRLNVLTHNNSNPLANLGLAAGKITHVFYVIKENRTYDQVLGDLPQGNGDKSLTLFGRDVTPNHHALAERFVLLDNLYACGEVSGDGWTWSTQGMADAYVERNVPYHYSNRGRKFDFEGQNNGYVTGGFPARDEHGKPLTTMPSLQNGAPAIPDVASTGRNLWDTARQAGISLRNYGFLLSFNDRVTGLAGGPDNYPGPAGLQPPGHDLAGISDIDYRRFDLDFPDSDAPFIYATKTGNSKALFKKSAFGQYKVPSRFTEWNREFQMMLARSPDGSAVPALTMIRLPNDHTTGATPGKHTPRSYVADNDYALGEIVQAISRSPIWRSSAVFVIEDDAQSGADHVDAHRTIGFIISPWIKANSVDHHFCNTDSMLKTIELILGLGPMSQYDAVADPIMDWDDSPSNAAPYDAIAASPVMIAERNPKVSDLSAGDPRRKMALESEKMDFTHADAAPALELDQIVWKTIKGPDSVMPIMHRTLPGGVHPAGDNDDDDDN